MNLLTKNRILEKGDEYKTPSGDWKLVPDKDVGLQIMFSPYTEVRRPSEAPAKSGDGNVTLVPPPKPKVEPLPAPAPLTGDADAKTGAKPEPVPEAAKSGLPTVISPKAHGKSEAVTAETSEAALTSSYMAGLLALKKIFYPKDAKYTKWIGRNGTFHQIGIRVAALPKSGIIRLRPIGKRGIAKNAIMEIPMESVPALIDTLKEVAGLELPLPPPLSLDAVLKLRAK